MIASEIACDKKKSKEGWSISLTKSSIDSAVGHMATDPLDWRQATHAARYHDKKNTIYIVRLIKHLIT